MTRRLLAPSMVDLLRARQALSRLKESFGKIERALGRDLCLGPHLAWIVILLDQIRRLI